MRYAQYAIRSLITSLRTRSQIKGTIYSKFAKVIMGHTEDAYPECFGRAYIVQAEIVDEDGNLLEQFSSIAYPGFLPGYTMGFNQHGMIHSINTVNPEKRNANGTRNATHKIINTLKFIHLVSNFFCMQIILNEKMWHLFSKRIHLSSTASHQNN